MKNLRTFFKLYKWYQIAQRTAIGEDLLKTFFELYTKGFTRNLRDIFEVYENNCTIPTNLVINSLLFLCCPFVETKNKN